jgi:hypothetical protein
MIFLFEKGQCFRLYSSKSVRRPAMNKEGLEICFFPLGFVQHEEIRKLHSMFP